MRDYTPYDTEDDGWQDYIDMGKIIQTCHECAFLIEFVEKHKWPLVCGRCGRNTNELVQPLSD